jgi:MFS transporter, PPP family, 3-phenylpropionic acid transporter
VVPYQAISSHQKYRAILETVNPSVAATQRLPLIPRLFYFAWFTAIGAYSPFITLYYRERGLDLSQIGYLLALPGFAQLLAGPLWGLLADSFRLHRFLLPVAIVGAVIPAALIGGIQDFGIILILAAFAAIFMVPIAPLSDAASLELLGERRDRYGSLRVWGAIGWGLSTVVSGVIVANLGLDIIFWLYPLVGFFALMAALMLPKVQFVSTNTFAAARSLIRDLRWVRFVVCMLLIGVSSSLMHGFLSIYFAELGAGRDQIGLAYTIASLSEMPVMVIATRVLYRWGAKPLLLCGGLAYGLRLAIFALTSDPNIALAAQLLHGFCFGAIWVAGVHEAQRLAPPGLAATAQSLLSTAMYGVAVVLANLVGGMIYQQTGYATLFGAASALAILGAFGFLIPIAEPKPDPAPHPS